MGYRLEETNIDGPGWAVWAQSAVNGLLGDYLQAEENPLAIRMGLYAGGKPLRLESAQIAALDPLPTTRIVLLVHGLSCSESAWGWREQDGTPNSYGHMLQADLGYTPIALRYNSGLPIAGNGHQLSAMLEEFVRAYPCPIEDLLLIGHSMGGLVLRHACHAATLNRATWLSHVRRIVYLGTPHVGADLERLAHIAATTLDALPNRFTRFVGQFINLRSQGVRDLRTAPRFGDVTDPLSRGELLPWIPNVKHCIIAGTLGGSTRHAASVLLGDGLVRPPHNSTHRAPAKGLPPNAQHVRVFPGVHHVGLARSQAVYAQIYEWCAADELQERSLT